MILILMSAQSIQSTFGGMSHASCVNLANEATRTKWSPVQVWNLLQVGTWYAWENWREWSWWSLSIIECQSCMRKKKGYQSNKKPNNFDQTPGPLAMGLLSLFFGLFSLTRFIVATFGYVREDRYFRFMALKNFWV